MLLFIYFLTLYVLVSGIQVEQCSKLHSQQNTTINGKDVIFTYEIDVDIYKSASKYYNNLKFFNYKSVPTNNTEYSIKQFMPLQYWDGNEGEMIKCNDFNDNCTITIPDGVGFLELPLKINDDTNEFPSLIDDLFIDNGIVFITDHGVFFNSKTRNCFLLEEFAQRTPNIIFFTQICCREYTLITVPDNDNPCIKFESTTVFTSNTSNSVISNFTANYSIKESKVNVQITDYYGPPTGNYYFSPNEDLIYCADNKSGCILTQDLPNEDFQLGFLLDVWDPYPQTFHYDALTGQLIRRNDVYMKEENKPFTNDDKCWNRVENSFNNSIATTNFCCKKFKNDPIDLSCKKYKSTSIIYQDNNIASELNITYTINSKDLDVLITNYTSSINSNAQFEIYKKNGVVSETCIVSLYSTNECRFNYQNNLIYEFEFRTSVYNDGFNMTSVLINNLQFQNPLLTATNPCKTFNNPYKGIDTSITSKTDFCCITESN